MRYTYRCPEHGDFDADYPMSETPRFTDCPIEHKFWQDQKVPKVLSANFSFPYGRDVWHGPTDRERSDRALAEARSAGLDPVPIRDVDLSQQHTDSHGRIVSGFEKKRNPKIREAAKRALAEHRS